MTALKQYIRLESTGYWQATPTAELREVIISFGKSTLILRDGSDAPLTHWALSATHVVTAGKDGTHYSPDPDGRETLLISDSDMIAAIAQVSAAHAPRRKKVRRRNRLIVLMFMLAVAGLAAALGPDLLRSYTANRISPLGREAIATEILRTIERENGAACGLDEAQAVFQRMGDRILPGASLRVTIVPLAGGPTASLPGGRILLDPQTLAEAKNPEELAGWLVQEALRARRTTPMTALLQAGSLGATIDLLSTGKVDPGLVRISALSAGAPATNTPASLDEDIARTLGQAGLPSLPFATAVAREDGSFERVRRLRAGNAVDVDAAFEPALSDGDWVLLKGMCGR